MNAGNTPDIDEQGAAAMADTQFTIIVDPPNCTWEQFSDGVIYWLHACLCEAVARRLLYIENSTLG